jgi:GNAT superfamily N-acetyltransferase
MAVQQPVVKRPGECGKAELTAFHDLVVSGGEVDPRGLVGRIAKAEALAFLYDDAVLIGVGALKNPKPSHKKEVFDGAGVAGLADSFPFEIGWILVAPTHRKRGHATSIVAALTARALGRGVFATARSANETMHRAFGHCGFVREGGEWPSRLKSESLRLFVRRH